jgi:hypothetical protein
MAISHKHQPFSYPDYISPLPADELIKIGVMKQDLYSKGVEKVQNQIETLDQYGFSLVKDVDKQYFSQEMDKLLKAVNEASAKTDFSNMNNLRSLLSISKPLESNPLILNALESSKELQRRQQILASMKPELRSSANDDYFMTDAEDWANDGKVGSKLAAGKAYVPYVDINAKIAEKIKLLKPDMYNYIANRQGGIINIVNVERLTDKRVADAIISELDEKERTQLQIDARYSLKTMGPDQVQTMALKDFEERLNEANKGLVTAGEDLYKAKQMYNTSPTEYNRQLMDAAEAKVRDFSIARESAEENINKFSDVTQIDTNAYYPYYLSNYVTGKARAFAYDKTMHEFKPDDVYIKNLEHNAASARDYQKHLYNMQEKRYEAELKGTKFTPSGSPIMPNNDPDKAISGGQPTKSISTEGGLVGENLASVANHLEYLSALLETDEVKNNEANSSNLKQFLEDLTRATKTKGTQQLKDISVVYNKWMGNIAGNQYTQNVWNKLYTMVSRTPSGGKIPVEQVKSYITNSLVNPLTKVHSELTSKTSPETRIAINNSLDYDKNILSGMNFLNDEGISIFSDDNIILGTPSYTLDVSTGTPKVKLGTFGELSK